MPAPDFTDKYNTKLTPEQEKQFEAKYPNRADLADYDLRGAWLAGAAKADNGHLPDTFKKPNHPTFSEESQYSGKDGYVGGKWKDVGGGKWEYAPSQTNLSFRSADELTDYFKKSDPTVSLARDKPAPRDPGVKVRSMPEGAATYQKLISSGFSAQEADKWRADQTAKLQAGGFKADEIAKYWGDGDPDFKTLDTHVANNLAAAHAEDPKVASSPIDMLAAGFDMSVTGLAIKGPPKTVAPEDAGLMDKIWTGVGQFTGDLPATIAGFFGGAAAGTPAGPAGSVVGAGAGSAALPAAMREVLMDHYEHPEGVTNFTDFMARSSKIAYGTAKEGVVGGASAFVGGKAGATVLKATASKVASAIADGTSYLLTATGLGAAMDKRIPKADDFIAGAALMLGFHAGAKGVKITKAASERVAQNMRDIYRRSGVTPQEQVNRAKADPAYAQTVMGRNPDNEPLPVRDAPAEPEPYKKTEIASAEPPAPPRPAPENKQPLSGDEQLNLVRQLERSGDNAISPAGAIGRYQITPDTARTYGFDPTRLKDPEYNTEAAKKILSDLSSRYKKPDGTVDQEAVLIAYNAGPGRANAFVRGGRDRSKLPVETQRYLEHADRLGGLKDDKPPEFEKREEGVPPTKEELVQTAHDVIANPVEASISEKLVDAKRRFVFDAVSELSPAERIDRALGTPDTEFGIADGFRQVYGSAGRAWHRLYVGGLERDGLAYSKTEAPPLMSIYDSAKEKGSIQELTAVRIAARTVELAERGIKTPLKVEDAAEIMRTLGPKYKEELEVARKANDAKIDDYVAAGMMSKEGAAAMKADNRNWFPQVPENVGVAAARKGSRFGPVQVVRKIKGSEGQILDPRTQEIKSFYSMAAVAEKNRATAALMKALSKEDMEAMGIRFKEGGEDVAILDKEGNINTDLLDGTGKYKVKDNEFAYYVDGQRHVYEADDPQIAQMIRGMSPIKEDQALGVLRWFAKIKRSGITDMPDFIARAMAKDAGASAILSKWGGVPFVNTIRGLFHLSKADPIFQDFVANGGLGAALSDMDAQWVVRDLHRMETEAGFFAAVINRVSHPLEAAQLLMQRMDAATRVGVKMRAEAYGLPPLKAATEARKASLDFAEKSGHWFPNLLASMVPFYRPSVLGLKQAYEAFRDRPFSTGAKSVAYIAAPAAMLYVLNTLQDENLPDDQKFENLPRWQKDTMFILPVVNGVRLRLPMPPLLGTMVGGLTNRMLDYFRTKDPRAFKEWGNTLWAQMAPPIFPAAVLPIYEHIANYNSFTDKQLIPSSLEGMSGYEQFTPNTSEVAKRLSQVLGPPGANIYDVSPIVLDNYVRQWTGGVGQAVLRITNGVFNPGRLDEWADNPFVGSFFARNPGMSAQPITDFYDKAAEVEGRHKDLAAAIERGDLTDIDFTSNNVQAFIELHDIRTALTQQRAAIHAITADETMTKDEKRQYIDSIASGMVQVAKGGLAIVDSVK